MTDPTLNQGLEVTAPETGHKGISAPLKRESFLLLLRSALNFHARPEVRFARQAAERWLDKYPADLEVRFLHALACLAENPTDSDAQRKTLATLDELCLADPEYWEAQKARAQITQWTAQAALPLVEGCVFALESQEVPLEVSSRGPVPAWSLALQKARQALNQGKLELAETELNLALDDSALSGLQEQIPLIGLTHLQIMQRGAGLQASGASGLLSLSELYHQRWPTCLPIMLILASLLMNGGESERGVALLHEAAAGDLAGGTARRLWGRDHPYRSLWLENLELSLDLPVPASVGAALGWNQLTDGGPLEAESEEVIDGEKPPMKQEIPAREESVSDEEFLSAKGFANDVQRELDGIAHSLNQPQLARADGRFPVYVAWSSRQGLERLYGMDGFSAVDAALQALVSTLNRRTGWNAHVLYADDPASAAALGLKPVPARDAWQLKLSLADLDRSLGKQGRMIGALLVVGGPEIIPFHRLPNPVDDPDVDVPSDNPYTSLDENYFVPEWPVGRISAGSGRDAQGLVHLLEQITVRHQGLPQERPWLLRFLESLLGMISPLSRGQKTSLGCTAAIWKDASEAVFKPIGSLEEMLVSPPFDSDQFLNGNLVSARLGYFNLHGVEDSPEWFGQRDPRTRQGRSQAEWLAEDDYPVALRPGNLDLGAGVPEFIFTEACYGANINGKSVDEAISLKFLSLGCLGLVGSTCTAYGSVTTPLSAADMLGRMFWENLKNGMPTGEALRRAKVDLAAETHRKQGFLDGEDQKTLIQFVLYGDPLATFEANPQKTRRRGNREVGRSLDPQPVTTVQEQPQSAAEKSMNPDVIESVKQAVAKYLPGMEDAQMSLSGLFPELPGSGAKRLNVTPGPKRYSAHSMPRQVVTLHKRVESKNLTHESLARLTLDEDGVLIKMTVSR